MISLTALVLTFNEKENIERTLAALKWVERVAVVDSFSTDGTGDIAKRIRPDVSFIQRRFDTHAQQWNFGLDQISSEWVLALDADYEVTPDLAREIQHLAPEGEVGGYEAAFRFQIFGRRLRTSVYPERVILFRRVQARYLDDGHTQRLKIDSVVKRLRGVIIHDDRKPLTRWLASQDKYAALEAKQLLTQRTIELTKPDRLRKRVFFAAPAMFLHLTVIKGLLFEGWPGWFYVCQRVIAELLLSMRILIERQHLEEHSVPPPTSASERS